MSSYDEILQLHSHEVRRGSVVIAVLELLTEPHYGYALIEMLNDAGIVTDANTLYPLLRRLEKQGMLKFIWNTDESRPRKYYQTTVEGEMLLQSLLAEWNSITASLSKLKGESP